MNSSNTRKSNFLVQGTILAVASIITRIIGLVYRIPLTAIIGDVGNNYYGCAFDIYSMLLLISSYSLPLAVSKMVSARMAKGEKKNAYRVFKGAFLFALVSGGLAALTIYFGAGFLTGTLLKTPYSIYALRVLAPTLLIVAVLGVMRGFFQGLGTMMPSAVSQIIEQIINAVVSVWAAYMLFSYGSRVGAILGDQKNLSAAYGAAGGTLGTGLGAFFALLFILFVFGLYSKVFKRQMRRDRNSQIESYENIFKIIIITIIPVLLSTTIYNISSIIDQGIFKNVAILQGYSEHRIDVWWGVFSGKYKVLTNVPISVASAMAASCVPSLSAAFAVNELSSVRKQINVAIRFIMVIAFPSAVGMCVLASPILQLLFHDTSKTSALMLQVGAISIVFYSLSTLSNGLLQGINKMRLPVRNAVIALVLHIAFLFVLMYQFHLNIYSVVYANAFFAFIMCLLNAISLKKHSGYKQELKRTFFIPAISAGGMGIAVFIIYHILKFIIRSNAISTLVAVCFGAISYLALLLLLKGLTEDELRRFPKGYLIINLAKKLHFL